MPDGRLAQYRYYNLDQGMAAALKLSAGRLAGNSACAALATA